VATKRESNLFSGFRRPAGLRATLGVWLFGALASIVWAHPEGGKGGNSEPPYEGPGHTGAPVAPGTDGMALDFPARGVTLLSWMTLGELPGEALSGADIWGYASPSGREYAMMGLLTGTAFVEVTDPVNPQVVGFIPGPESIWRDMKVWGERAYIVNDIPPVEEEDEEHEHEQTRFIEGIQVIDLSRIDDGVVERILGNSRIGPHTSHNIAINPQSGFAYLCGSSEHNGGLIAIDINRPAVLPHAVGAWDENYIHDALVVTYTEGPFAGREIAFAAAGLAGVKIIDVTDKSNMFTVASRRYPGLEFTHHSWLDGERRYLYVNDEFDELRNERVESTTTYVFDVLDIENPIYVRSFTNGSPAIDHNPMGRDGFLYEANYTSGLRVFDIHDVNDVNEVGYFDTHPEDDEPEFTGAWGVYTDLPSGVLLVSTIDRGLFVFDATGATTPNGVPRDVWGAYQ